MLSHVKRLMVEYIMLLVKMVLDNLTNQQEKMNYEHLRDLQFLLEFGCILLLLKCMHIFIKFTQMKDVFVCNLVDDIKVY
jgi:hypothetical protein